METPTHTYLDITVSNNSVGLEQAPTPLVFYTRRDADYLFRPDDYFVSVCRWSIDARLPMIIPQLPIGAVPSQDAAGEWSFPTVYWITIRYGGVDYQQNVLFQSEIAEPATLPPIPVITGIKQLYDNPYFYISSVAWWLHLMNKALLACYGLITSPPQPVPYITYNYDGTFRLAGNLNLGDAQAGGTSPNPIQIWFNSPLYTLFQFPAQYSYLATLPPFTNASRKNYLILFTELTQTITLPTVPPSEVIYTQTEMPSLPFWSPVSSVSFSSQGIPVEPTNVTPTVVLGVGNSISSDLSNLGNNINVANIITDFEINLKTGVESRTINYYVPAGEYRLIDIIGNRPLSEINIIVYWRDKIEGTLHPMYLHSGGAASMKLLFRKRNFYSEKN